MNHEKELNLISKNIYEEVYKIGKVLNKINKREYKLFKKDFVFFIKYSYSMHTQNIRYKFEFLFNVIYKNNLNYEMFKEVILDKRNHPVAIKNNEVALSNIKNLFSDYSVFLLNKELKENLIKRTDNKTKLKI